jgi:Nitrile hydratase beta subunit
MSRFQAGQRVLIPSLPTVGHSRVPGYTRGAIGYIERVLREFLIPEDDAFGRPQGRRRMLYRVRLATRDLWPDYRGNARDEVQLEIYEHWLEPVEELP